MALPTRERLRQRQMALAVWDNEGGAEPGLRQLSSDPRARPARKLQLTNNELAQLRARVVALENLMIALLAGTSILQLDRAREMAAYISPRPGFTQHPLTIHAAAQMLSIVQRAGRFSRTASGK